MHEAELKMVKTKSFKILICSIRKMGGNSHQIQWNHTENGFIHPQINVLLPCFT